MNVVCKMYGVSQNKYPSTKIAISQKCVNTFAPHFAHLFGTKLCTNALLCAVFNDIGYVKLTETEPLRTNFTTERKLIFTARRVCIVRTMSSQDVCRSVRLTVCLSHPGIVSKRLHISSKNFRHRVAPPF